MPISKIVKCIHTTRDMWERYVLTEGTLYKAHVVSGGMLYSIKGGYYYPSWFVDANRFEQVKYYNEERRKDENRNAS